MIVSLTLCEGREYEKRRVVLFKTVTWPSVPPEGAILFCGMSADGEETGFSATIRAVYWSANGDVSVKATHDNLLDEYDDVVADVARDGFLEHAEWSSQR